MEVASSSSSNTSTSWVSNLSVLPPRLRLEFQKTITNDITIQSTLPSQPPSSRAYASLKQKVPTNGLGGIKSTVLGNLKNAPGGKIKAIQRQFPSTAEILADMILQAAHAVKAKPLQPFESSSGSSTTVDGESGKVSSSSTVGTENAPSVLSSSTVPSVTDQEFHALVHEIQQYGLDTSYRIPVCRNLQRRLPVPSPTSGSAPMHPSQTGDHGWNYEGTNRTRYPHALEISNGSLTQKVQAALDQQIQERTKNYAHWQQQQQHQLQQRSYSSSNNVPTATDKGNVVDEKASKNTGLGSSTIDDADLALLDEALDELD